MMTPALLFATFVALASTTLAAPPPLSIELPDPLAEYRSGQPTPADQAEVAAEVQRRWPELQWSPGLADAARIWAASTADLGAAELPPSFLEAVMLRTGNVEPSAVASAVDGGSVNRALEHVAAVISASPEPFTHLGLSRVETTHGPRWGLVLSLRPAHVEPFPAVLAPGSTARLEFRLEIGFDDPDVVLIAHGHAANMPVRQLADTWEATVRAPRDPGIAWVMVRANTAKGDALIAQAEIGIGRRPPGSWQGSPILDEDPSAALETVEARMVELINLDRTAHGLPALVADAELATVARAHSRDMRDGRFFDHDSPTHGNLTARLASAGYPAVVARENLSRSATIHAAESALMASLTHRANLLATDITNVGVGLVRDHGLGAVPAYLVTQAFATRLTPKSTEELVWSVRRELDRRRRSAGAAVFRSSDNLDRRACEYIRTGELDTAAEFSTPEQPCDEQSTWHRIRAVSVDFDQLSDVRFPEWITDLSLSHFGLAIVQRSGGYGPHSKVAVLAARPLEAPEAGRVERRLSSFRERNDLPPLPRLKTLDLEALRLAEMGADLEKMPPPDLDRLQSELAETGTAIGGLVNIAQTVAHLYQLSIPRRALDPSVTSYGLGIASRFGEDCMPTHTVVLLFASSP